MGVGGEGGGDGGGEEGAIEFAGSNSFQTDETGEQLSKKYKSSSRSGTEDNLREEVKADSDVRADDRTGKEETSFLWTRLSLNRSTPGCRS